MTTYLHHLLPTDDDPAGNQDTANRVRVPGQDGKYHISDENGGTLCGAQLADNARAPYEMCSACEWIAALPVSNANNTARDKAQAEKFRQFLEDGDEDPTLILAPGDDLAKLRRDLLPFEPFASEDLDAG